MEPQQPFILDDSCLPPPRGLPGNTNRPNQTLLPLFGLAPDGVYPLRHLWRQPWSLTPRFHPYLCRRYISVAL